MTTLATTWPVAVPSMVAVYLQPKRNLARFKAAGCGVAFGRDREANADGTDGVPLAMWCDAAKAAGLKYVVDSSGNFAADAADPSRLGVLYPVDEIDDQIINAQDAKNPAAEEAVYVALETFYKNVKAAAPNLPVWINIDGAQFRWGKANYPRIFKACDRFSVDFYPVQLGLPVTDYAALLDKIQATPGGDKLGLAWIEVSNQHGDPAYYKSRAPTVAEWQQEVTQAVARGLSVGWFPQSIGGDGTKFLTDATDPAIAQAMTAWANPGTSAGGVAASGGSSAPTPPAADPIVSIAYTHASGAVEVFDRRK